MVCGVIWTTTNSELAFGGQAVLRVHTNDPELEVHAPIQLLVDDGVVRGDDLPRLDVGQGFGQRLLEGVSVHTKKK